ncbi:Slp family lipoprotein [Halofilum ochraceum]|uniref:Slp family lipoprotein n=1 Tax=Halofilum ochraceum TaxID=1611323 RepID=UPI0008D9BA49|nr:Slp family lipoprotein [Halofilum ochraceum]
MVVRTLYSIVLLLALAGCASAPLATEGVDAELRPAAVREDPEATTGRTVLWGGVIADARNLPERTRLEIVAYPVSERTQRPDTDAASLGRFRAYVDGYLETAVYGAGRRFTVRGRVQGTETGRIDEAEYTFPVVEAEAFELWPEQTRRERGSGVNFGFGIILSN